MNPQLYYIHLNINDNISNTIDLISKGPLSDLKRLIINPNWDFSSIDYITFLECYEWYANQGLIDITIMEFFNIDTYHDINDTCKIICDNLNHLKINCPVGQVNRLEILNSLIELMEKRCPDGRLLVVHEAEKLQARRNQVQPIVVIPSAPPIDTLVNNLTPTQHFIQQRNPQSAASAVNNITINQIQPTTGPSAPPMSTVNNTLPSQQNIPVPAATNAIQKPKVSFVKSHWTTSSMIAAILTSSNRSLFDITRYINNCKVNLKDVLEHCTALEEYGYMTAGYIDEQYEDRICGILSHPDMLDHISALKDKYTQNNDIGALHELGVLVHYILYKADAFTDKNNNSKKFELFLKAKGISDILEKNIIFDSAPKINFSARFDLSWARRKYSIITQNTQPVPSQQPVYSSVQNISVSGTNVTPQSGLPVKNNSFSNNKPYSYHQTNRSTYSNMNLPKDFETFVFCSGVVTWLLGAIALGTGLNLLGENSAEFKRLYSFFKITTVQQAQNTGIKLFFGGTLLFISSCVITALCIGNQINSRQ